jgi:beta-lactamase class D
MDAVRLKCCVSPPPRVGFDRMKTFVDKLEYGNRDIGGAPIDYLWLSGNLRISPLQQIGFLDGLRRGVLPVSKVRLLESDQECTDQFAKRQAPWHSG